MSAFDFNAFTDATADADDQVVPKINYFVFGLTGIYYTARYVTSGGNAYVYVQFDRALTSSSPTITTSNYTIAGSSPPSVTSVSFVNGRNFLQLTLSAVLGGGTYTLAIAAGTLTDGEYYNDVPLVITLQ